MIPEEHIDDWAKLAPWEDRRMIFQDLIIVRCIVLIFEDEWLRCELRFRGGTALHKVHFLIALRFSEDIDVVRVSKGPIGPILDRLRAILEPWLGRARFEQSPIAPKLIFRIAPPDGGAPIRLKIEINTRETEAFDPTRSILFSVTNGWFSGEAPVSTYSIEEMLATKLRALLQRAKGRDLYDAAMVLEQFENLDIDRTVDIFGRYLAQSGQNISRAEAQQRMFAKLDEPQLLLDIQNLLPVAKQNSWDESAMTESVRQVLAKVIDRFPGDPWAETPAMMEKHGISW